MQKIIKTHCLSFLMDLIACPSLSALTFIDLSLTQILSPDSLLFCSNKDVPVKVVIGLVDGASVSIGNCKMCQRLSTSFL